MIATCTFRFIYMKTLPLFLCGLSLHGVQMARKYRKIDPRIWSDEAFLGLTPTEKLIALYCLSSDQANRIGLFKFSLAMAAEDTGLNLTETFREGFRKVCQRLSWCFDEVSRTLFFPTWWRYNEPENANQMIGCLEDLHDVPRSELVTVFLQNTQYLSKKYNIDALSQTVSARLPKPLANLPARLPKPLAYQEQEQEQEQDNPLLVPQGTSQNSEFPNSQIPNLDPPIRKRKSAATPPKVGGRYQYPPEFAAIVAAYVPVCSPVGDLLDAWRAWTAIPDAERADLGIAVANYCRSCARSQTFTKHLATFLRDRWRGWIELSEAQQAAHDPEEAARLAKRREFNRQLEETRTNRLAKEQALPGPQLPAVRIKTV